MTQPKSPLGLFAIDDLLDDEERATRDSVRRFVDDRVRPEIAEWYESGVVPVRDLSKELGALGLLGMHLEGYGCAGSSAVAYGLAGGRPVRPRTLVLLGPTRRAALPLRVDQARPEGGA